VLRMFARLRSPRLTGLRLVWPEGQAPLWVSRLETAIFDGDTVNCFAGFERVPTGKVRLLGAGLSSAESQQVACAVLSPADEARTAVDDALARMAAMARLPTLTAADAVDLAVAYQLVTDRTNFLLVHARAEGESPTLMPELHQVAQMVPAGWGGVGSVADPAVQFSLSGADDLDYLDIPAFLRRQADSDETTVAEAPFGADLAGGPPAPAPAGFTGLDYLDIPDSLPSVCFDQPSHEGPLITPLALSIWLRNTPRNRWPRTYRELQAISLAAEVLDWLELVVAIRDSGRWEEATVVTTFLHCLSSDEFHALLVPRGHIAETARAVVQGRQGALVGQPEVQTSSLVDPTLAARIRTALQGITADHWPDHVFSLTT
jgi:Ca-activated chloride channel homolog